MSKDKLLTIRIESSVKAQFAKWSKSQGLEPSRFIYNFIHFCLGNRIDKNLIKLILSDSCIDNSQNCIDTNCIDTGECIDTNCIDISECIDTNCIDNSQDCIDNIVEEIVITDNLKSNTNNEIKQNLPDYHLSSLNNLLHESELRINSLVEEKIKTIQENLTINQILDQNLIEEIKHALIADSDFISQVQSMAKIGKNSRQKKINNLEQTELFNLDLPETSPEQKTQVNLLAELELKPLSERQAAIQTLEPLNQTLLAKRLGAANSTPINLKLKDFDNGKISYEELEYYIRKRDPNNLMWVRVENSKDDKKTRFYEPVV